jgi:hypothetical protein
MTESEQRGKAMTIRLFASCLLISIYIIVTYNILVPHVETKKILQQIIRFCITVAFMYFIFKGKKWAKDIFSVLLGLGVIFGMTMIFGNSSFNAKIPIITMTLIYVWTIYHLNFSNNFKAYFNKILS